MEKRSGSHVRTSKCKPSQKKSSGGKITRNPYLNFLRDFRKSNKHKYDMRELVRRGAQLWRGMSAREKSPYVNLSKQAPRYKTARGRRHRRGRRRRKGSRRRRRRRRKRHASFSTSSGCTEDDSTEEPTSDDEVGDEKNERKPVEQRKEKRKSQSHSHEDTKDKNKNSGRNEHNENKDRNSTSREKRNQDYELKYKNPKYEDTRDFI